jgi:hypothetical protein
MVDKTAVWERIRRHAGSEFRTATGLPFTYAVPGNFLRVTREGREINRSLSRTNFEKGDRRHAGSRPVRPLGPSGLLVHLGHPHGPSDPVGRLVTTVEAQWFAPVTRLGVALAETPRLASWNAATDPDQEALQSYLRAAEQKLLPSLERAAGPTTLRLDVGLTDETPLLEHRDLDNFLYPLAAHLSKRADVNLVSVMGTKRHAGRSFLAIEPSHPTNAPDTAITVHTTASASNVAYKEQIRDQFGGSAPLPEGPVHLEVAFVVGPRRNWLNLWKPTIDALGGLLGLEGAPHPGTPETDGSHAWPCTVPWTTPWATRS